MVTNRMNRRRANRGTPPICASKPIPPFIPPPYAAIAKFRLEKITMPWAAQAHWEIDCRDLPHAETIYYTFHTPPGFPPIPPGWIPNGPPGLSYLTPIITAPGNYIIRLDFTSGTQIIARKWASIEFP